MRSFIAAIFILMASGYAEAKDTEHARVVAQVRLPPAPPDARLIAVTIGAIHNPDRVPVSLRLELADAGSTSAAPTPVGLVSLYPSDQPGRFIVRLPHAVGGRRMPHILIVTLIGQPGHPLEPRLTLSDVHAEWLPEP